MIDTTTKPATISPYLLTTFHSVVAACFDLFRVPACPCSPGLPSLPFLHFNPRCSGFARHLFIYITPPNEKAAVSLACSVVAYCFNTNDNQHVMLSQDV